MIGAHLHQHIAGFEQHFRVVQQHGDLAGEHDGIVDGLGAMHHRMPAALAMGGGGGIAQSFEQLPGLRRGQVAHGLRFRLDLIDAYHRAVARGHLSPRPQRWFALGQGIGGNGCWRGEGAPDIGRGIVMPRWAGMHKGCRTIRDDNGFARGIMASDNTPHIARLAW